MAKEYCSGLASRQAPDTALPDKCREAQRCPTSVARRRTGRTARPRESASSRVARQVICKPLSVTQNIIIYLFYFNPNNIELLLYTKDKLLSSKVSQFPVANRYWRE